MKLSRVDIKGFKSIAKKTRLTFPGSVTCIAGPNGCGKSNVIDAIKWALGEQSVRSLRAGSMSDVIFSGTEDAPAGSMARVTLKFVRDGGYFPKSLDGFDEVDISRRLYRTGESLYTINDVRCRLRDVHDLFMDTGLDRHGYAIIEQGKIKDIIQAKPDDIRYLIEEAAEVGRFRVKRTEALKRLEATRGNLDRVQDLLSEVGRQRNSLRAQAAKARRYQVLRDQINTSTRTLWAYEIIDIKRNRSELEQKLRGLDGYLELLHAKRDEHKSELASLRQCRDTVREDLERVKTQITEAENRLNLARSDRLANQGRLDDLKASLQMLENRIVQSGSSAQDALLRIEEGRREAARLEREINEQEAAFASRSGSFDELRTEARALEARYDQQRAEMFDAMGHVRAMEQRLNSMQKRAQEVAVNIKRRESELRSLKESEESLKAEQVQIVGELAAREQVLSEMRETQQALERRAIMLQEQLDEHSQQLITREKELAGIRAKLPVLERIIKAGTPKESSGVLVSEIIKARPGYEAAVARSLGEVLDYQVIDDLNQAIDQDGPGFVLREPQVAAAEEPAGVIGPLADYLEIEPDYESLAGIAQSYLVKDLESAIGLWEGGKRQCSYVTLAGEVLEPGGIVRTSNAKYAEVLRARSELDELNLRSVELTDEVEGLCGLQQDSRAQLKNLRERQESVRRREREEERELERQRSRAGEIAARLERMDDREKSYANDIAMWRELDAKLVEDTAQIGRDKEQQQEAIAEQQAAVRALEEQKLAASRRLEEAQAGLDRERARVGELKVARASHIERIKGFEEDVRRRETESQRDRERIAEFGATEQQIMAQISAAEQAAAAADDRLKALLEERALKTPLFEKASEELLELERVHEAKGRDANERERERNEIQLKFKEQEIALNMRMERMEARFGRELPEVPEEFDLQQVRQEVSELQTKIENMGQINFTSIEAHEEAQSRFDDLHRQYEDLVQAVERLREVIANIEKESNKAFMKTYVQVRANFQELFTTMFDGGTADLVLQESEDSMEAGVEIFACPPKKKPKAMSLLSEGEKTLCAISFVFALFKVRPSPFCILDEVDAPLDDANVERMARLVRSFAADTQFIVVTHNRRTMEMADVIYGVTFDVPGITKVVSIDLQDAPESAADDEESAA